MLLDEANRRVDRNPYAGRNAAGKSFSLPQPQVAINGVSVPEDPGRTPCIYKLWFWIQVLTNVQNEHDWSNKLLSGFSNATNVPTTAIFATCRADIGAKDVNRHYRHTFLSAQVVNCDYADVASKTESDSLYRVLRMNILFTSPLDIASAD